MKTKPPMKPNTKVNCNSVEISDIDRAFIMFTERFWWPGNVTPCLIVSEYKRCIAYLKRCILGQNTLNFIVEKYSFNISEFSTDLLTAFLARF